MTNVLSDYQHSIKLNPLLTREQEINLAKKIKDGDVEAKQKMIESNYRLVINIAKKYYQNNKNLDFSELLSESQMGLIKAVDRFDYEKGFKFSTYACWWIKQAIMAYINESSCLIKTPNNNKSIYIKAKKIRKEYLEKFGYVPNNNEIADILCISPTTLNNVENTYVQVSSMDEQKTTGNTSQNKTRTLAEMVPDESNTNSEEIMIQEELRKLLIQSLKLLTPREEKILRLRFGLYTDDDDIQNFPMTLAELIELQNR